MRLGDATDAATAPPLDPAAAAAQDATDADSTDAGAWPLERVAGQLLLDLTSPQWETRHGAATGLRNVLTHQAACAGVQAPIAEPLSGEIHFHAVAALTGTLCALVQRAQVYFPAADADVHQSNSFTSLLARAQRRCTDLRWCRCHAKAIATCALALQAGVRPEDLGA